MAGGPTAGRRALSPAKAKIAAFKRQAAQRRRAEPVEVEPFGSEPFGDDDFESEKSPIAHEVGSGDTLPEAVDPEALYRAVMADPRAETTEKLRAARYLADLMHKTGGVGGGLSDMDRDEIKSEIVRIKALLAASD